MSHTPVQLTRRTALGLAGTAALGAAVATAVPASALTPTAKQKAGRAVVATINGRRAKVGAYAFPSEVDSLVLDNGLARFTFGRDDAAGGVVTGWTDTSITATSVIVDGTELAHDLNGVNPRDPDRQHSFYVDAGGGKTRLLCSRVDVVRVSPALVEVVFVDTTNTPMRHEHHLIMRRGKQGLYGYVVMTVVEDTSLNEIRMNTRWDRGILDHAYNWERGSGQQPTYAYLDTQTKLGDETWQVDGKNNPNLPWPDSNGGNLPAGSVYTKYNWSLYHHENPMFGHWGNGFGVWYTALGGVTAGTLGAFYGSGPQHQDLAIHQDALILNYFTPNHYGQTTHSVKQGYRRLFGPWFTFVTAGDEKTPAHAPARAAKVAAAEIAENRNGATWMDDPLYPPPATRTKVSGRIVLADGRPADGLWVLLSTEDSDEVFTIKEAAFFVQTDRSGHFELPGVPEAWAPGTTTPSTYNLYVFAAKGSATQQYKQTGIHVSGRHLDLGTISWQIDSTATFLWQVGSASRTGGEFELATDPATHRNPRSYEKPSEIPGNLTFAIGDSWEPRDWYYAQTQAGTWTIAFDLERAYTGTAMLTVSTSLANGGTPTVSVNGSATGLTGSVPSGNDSTLGRQADRSGRPRLGVISFPADRLVAGKNTIEFTRGTSGSGIGWDTVLLEVDEGKRAVTGLSATVRSIKGPRRASVWTVDVTNTGNAAAHDLRIAAIAFARASGGGQDAVPTVLGEDPNHFPVPIVALLEPGRSATFRATLDLRGTGAESSSDLDITVSADGGRTRTTTSRARGGKSVVIG